MNDLDELNFTPLPPVTDQDLAMVRGGLATVCWTGS